MRGMGLEPGRLTNRPLCPQPGANLASPRVQVELRSSPLMRACLADLKENSLNEIIACRAENYPLLTDERCRSVEGGENSRVGGGLNLALTTKENIMCYLRLYTSVTN